MSLVIAGLTRSYGSHLALAPTDLTVEPGQAWGLLGPNGSGKTTLLACLTGLRRPTAGSALIAGVSTRIPTARTHLGVLLERSALPGHLRLDSIASGDVLRELGLDDLGHRSVGTLSAGQHQRAQVAVALSGSPLWLVLDEPLTALDAPSAQRVTQAVQTRVRDGCAALIATHRPEVWESVLTHIATLDSGALTVRGPIAQVTADLPKRMAVDWGQASWYGSPAP